jgi:lactoylglutathione lyase
MRMPFYLLRVNDLERSLDYYTNVMRMKVLRKKDFPQGKFTLAFLGYEDGSDPTVLELAYQWN